MTTVYSFRFWDSRGGSKKAGAFAPAWTVVVGVGFELTTFGLSAALESPFVGGLVDAAHHGSEAEASGEGSVDVPVPGVLERLS
ncbi:hypothetical protein FEAC_13290 [Ferrimicrobium acidiphilum DSM 19497]|uniref:Uncharacterized protein n=1 Tax=Ferrimicrobium acidiphilum DSM 19497 TaxID=1121877 RepID=A0A0D8FUP0_9ACTN|nr:hypothetical protein FEAC_13290 [Ferrimicrobium acidiphilum DSM 19497]